MDAADQPNEFEGESSFDSDGIAPDQLRGCSPALLRVALNRGEWAGAFPRRRRVAFISEDLRNPPDDRRLLETEQEIRPR